MCDLLSIIEMERSTDSVGSGCQKLELDAGIAQCVAGSPTVDVIVVSDDDEDLRPCEVGVKNEFSRTLKLEASELFVSESGVKGETEGGAVSPARVSIGSLFSGLKAEELASGAANSLTASLAGAGVLRKCVSVKRADADV